MPFGKYEGKALDQLPHNYLLWLKSIELREPLRTAVWDEMMRRRWHNYMTAAPAVRDSVPDTLRRPIAEIIKRGFRACSLAVHPDHGGSDDEMRALIKARDWLSQNC